MSTSTDRIVKKVTLRAPVSRVWKAIADAKEFGEWFGIRLEGEFAPGKSMKGTWGEWLDQKAIAEMAKKLGLPPSGLRLPDGDAVFCNVERVEPERYFSFRWIPFGIDADVDPKKEPTTLVEFRLEPAPEGTLLTIVESGFDSVPEKRRARAFRMNTSGWDAQAENVRKYVEGE